MAPYSDPSQRDAQILELLKGLRQGGGISKGPGEIPPEALARLAQIYQGRAPVVDRGDAGGAMPMSGPRMQGQPMMPQGSAEQLAMAQRGRGLPQHAMQGDLPTLAPPPQPTAPPPMPPPGQGAPGGELFTNKDSAIERYLRSLAKPGGIADPLGFGTGRYGEGAPQGYMPPQGSY